ncbi:piggyBac transposable element-derived protein 4-like [Manduca sexta]|uniref:piggyBac transposable element-derived protein 4-like n=1 Tax=Manduca sexta TaxID=7130 RepID=UPI00189052D0|nr:piggyBac transposable element-derived protein 4-like [Manduca sexta]XP_037303474.1 piggyBac transposable element-derived protein 4-like [Manduca sexta]
MANRRWTGSDDEISAYLVDLDGNESEDGAEEEEIEENDEEVQFYRDRDEIRRVLESEPEEADDIPFEGESLSPTYVDPSEEDPPIIQDPEMEQEPAVRNGQTPRQAMRRLLWKKQGMKTSEDDIVFLGNLQYGELESLDTMYGLFSFFLSDDLLEKIVRETNLYAIQKDPNSTFSTSITEVRNYIGILLYFMSVIKYPNVRMYWSPKYGFAHIYNCMTINRFEKLKSLLHFNNNESQLPSDHPRHDKLHKIRPVIDHFNNRFALFPMEQRLSIDEQMCATKISHYLKQYLPNKPHKWGFKLFLLCSISAGLLFKSILISI